MIVAPEWPQQFYRKEKVVCVDRMHFEMAKITSDQHVYYPSVKDAVQNGLATTSMIVGTAMVVGAGIHAAEAGEREAPAFENEVRILDAQ